jgi:hypothetical protein
LEKAKEMKGQQAQYTGSEHSTLCDENICRWKERYWTHSRDPYKMKDYIQCYNVLFRNCYLLSWDTNPQVSLMVMYQPLGKLIYL